MAARTNPLTDTQIKQAKGNSNKTIKLADGEGLQLLIKPSGSKIWHLRYTNPITKNKTTLSFGSYPSVSLANARTQRKEARELLAQNIDPKKHREEELQKKRFALNNSFKSVFDEWFAIKETNVAIKQSKLIKRAFENHLFKELGAIPIGELKPQRVIEVVKKVEAQGKNDLAKRLCSRINEVMNYAANTGRIGLNPLSGITSAFKKVKAKSHPAITPDRLPWLLQLINNAELKRVTRCLIEWQLHTITRSNEAASTKWADIDINKKLWTIPADVMKMDKPHLIPLSEQTLNLLEVLKPLTGDGVYVFPSFVHGQGHINKETVNKAFRRMGLHNVQTAHGLRSVASSTLNEQGHDYDVIESALAHLDENQVRRAYNRTDYMERRRKLMAWWSNHIQECSTGNFSLSGLKHLKIV
ncbi:integrase domain-containing protein [Colwellia sp. 4_MG-2023]|uniref:integrase domain-containing protein n=1 Tax=unclassified Colwellia TaxID=196834 RepID=UPI0026E40A4F|nr:MULTISPECIES: integrase domain-containing protein [unclassified Colwellia]MDO6508839.1 integrase domain-containing protein [Colwellia sp. 5_MG-2023]MDO6557520.1 integrase domain-containing protein [Colwellia sp. 4_MG-2023]